MEGGCKDRCYKEMVGYSAHCTRCRMEQLDQGKAVKEVTDSTYYGETARSLKTRAEGHFEDYGSHQEGAKRKPVSSWMWDHTVSHHGGVISQNIRQDYTFRQQGLFRDPLSRQLDEAVRIGMVEGHGKVLGDSAEGVGGAAVVLNRKEEHYQPKVVHYNFYT